MSDVGATGPPVLDPIEALQQRSLDRLRAANARPFYDTDADAGERDHYYSGIDMGAGDPALREALSRLVATTHQRLLDYEPSEQLYPWVDLHPDGHLRNIYSGKQVEPEEVIRDDARIARVRVDRLTAAVRSQPTIGAVGLHAVGQEVEHALHFNCEHVVPQSWFAGAAPMKGDLHHLFTCEPTCNTKRANIPFADLSDLKTPVAGCGRTNGIIGFEPLAGKGPVARATLYFLLRYPGQIGDIGNGAHIGDELQPHALPTLLAWHDADPISIYEQHRNAAIFEAQGNRNPFIDLPELAARLDLTSHFVTPAPLPDPDATGSASQAPT